MSHVGYKFCPYQIFRHGNDWNRGSRSFDGKAGGVPESRDHSHPLRDEFRREGRQAVYLAVGIADIEDDVTAFDITERLHVGAQRFREGSAGLARENQKNTEDRHSRLLRPRRKRPRSSRAAEQRDELAPPDHSITSSARPSSGSGTVRPSALAVLRLMISSTFTTCWTGRSAGLSPFRIRPV